MKHTLRQPLLVIAAVFSTVCLFSPHQAAPGEAPLRVSGIFPHLTVYNGRLDPTKNVYTGGGGECGIGAVVPWAGRLWLITYPPHMIRGSSDKLWEIDEQLRLTARPESVGGTHANRMIHRESRQLIIGPYLIDEKGNVRALDVKNQLVGRMTATARHLTDPANMVYFYDMEGAVYEVNVHTLAVNKLFEKPVPGWHGKGAYTGQGRLIVANNGEHAAGGVGYSKLLVGGKPRSDEDCGVLAEWDSQQWRIIARRQFLDVTGPGGIEGHARDDDPVWAIGWDKRSVLLNLLDDGRWFTYRLPKASHAYDPKHGWYTEWPRIREAAPGKWLMDMHGMFFEFPPTFRRGQTVGLQALASHLRYVPDFCHWRGETIIAADDTSIMANPMAGLSQSNLWFGRYDELVHWGPKSGWGGPWLNDHVRADQPSEPFLIAGFTHRCLHLAHQANAPVRFTIEIDPRGDETFEPFRTVEVPAEGYAFVVLPADLKAVWLRVRTDRDTQATAYLHLRSPRPVAEGDAKMFAALAEVSESNVCGGLIRPGPTSPLQYVAQVVENDGRREAYYELDEKLQFIAPPKNESEKVKQFAAVKLDFDADDASVVMTQNNKRYRLPKGDPRFDRPLPLGCPRGIREIQSERYMMNIHGTFYEMPRDAGLPQIRPVASHNKQIMDYCSWRGLLVLSGTKPGAKPDGQFFAAADGVVGLWFGNVDDLWRLGKPVGRGGPWLNTVVEPDQPSDPYLMTNYDRKRMTLKHDADQPVAFRIEVNFDHSSWRLYQRFVVPPGESVEHDFPEGYGAHWLRAIVDRPCHATVQLIYE